MSTDPTSDPTSEESPQTPEPLRIRLPLPKGWIDPNAAKVVRRLHQFGHQVYFVGGCVRDLLLGRYPKDFDVATSASPREVKDAFRNCRLIGKRFRLAHILFRDTIVEVATFRRDPNAEEEGQEPVEAGEGDEDLLIRDDNVFGTAYDDAFRRDFTINALYYDLIDGEVIDYVGGFQDVEDRIIRTIGDPLRRFQEDPIRMLRAIKFATALGFSIEAATWEALRQVSGDLSRAAIPRIQEELFKMLRSGFSQDAFHLLEEAGLLKLILPDHSRILRRQDAAARGDAAPVEADDAAYTLRDRRRDSPGEEPLDELVYDADDDEAQAEASAPADPSDDEPAHEDEAGGGQGDAPRAPPAEEDVAPGERLAPLRGYLDSFDHMIPHLENHLYLAVLSLHPSIHKVDPGGRMSPQEQLTREAADWLAQAGADLRLPRRDREAARHAVMGFSRMLFRRDRRRLVTTLSRKSYFAEATALYGLHVLTTGEDVDTFWRLAERLGEDRALAPIIDAMERRHGPRPPKSGRGRDEREFEGRDRPRRRRRRGRGRGGQGGGGE